jgi:ATP-binding cassette subfamily B protein
MRSAESGQSLRDIFRNFWLYTNGDRRRLLATGICAVLVAGGEIATVMIFDAITGTVLGQAHMTRFWSLAAAWLGIAVVTGAAMFTGGYFRALASERFLLRLRDSVYARTQQLSPDFFSRHQLGDLIVRLTDDLEVIEELVASGLVEAAAAAVSVALFAGAALMIQWQLALITFAVAPLFWLASRGFSGSLSQASRQERAANSSLASTVEESLANQSLVQAFSRQADQAARLHGDGVSWLRARMAEARLNSLYAPVVYVTETVCILVVFGFGAWQVAGHRLSLGGLLSFAILLAYIYPEIQDLSGYRISMAAGRASAQRITDILSTQPLVTTRPLLTGQPTGHRRAGRPHPGPAPGRIEFSDVTFTYPGASRPVIDGLSFTAEPGTPLAITGPSGTGKSTVAQLLLRFYDPDRGRILLDGHDLRRLPLPALRDTITLLQQENLLFTGTIWDNITYSRPAATPADVHAAACAADVHDFVTALPDGYRTPVGQRGRLLSGGQRQRIAIARAILRDAPVLILDEPSTGLDPAGARRLLHRLRPAIAGRTTLLITHDPVLAALAGQTMSLTGPTTAAAAAQAHR